MKFTEKHKLTLSIQNLKSMKALPSAVICSLGGGLILTSCQVKDSKELRSPNILIAISDDQAFAHTGFAGCKFVNTPGFDRVAREVAFR